LLKFLDFCYLSTLLKSSKICDIQIVSVIWQKCRSWQENTGFEEIDFLPIISTYQQPADIWFLPRTVIFEYGYYYILKSKAI